MIFSKANPVKQLDHSVVLGLPGQFVDLQTLDDVPHPHARV
jgi:hypothetical protein